MAVTVRFFASLREQVGSGDLLLDVADTTTVVQVWHQAVGDKPLPANTLMAVNMEYAGEETPVHDGDEVAFFPPVTGGSHGC